MRHENKPLTFYYTGCLIGILMKEVRWATDTEKFDFNSLVDQEFATSLRETQENVCQKHTRRYIRVIRESFKLFYIEQKLFLHLLMKSMYYLSTFSSFPIFFPILICLSDKLFGCSKFLHLNWTNVHHGFCHASLKKVSLNQKGLRIPGIQTSGTQMGTRLF